jgi:biotin carboxyl carrier protein
MKYQIDFKGNRFQIEEKSGAVLRDGIEINSETHSATRGSLLLGINNQLHNIQAISWSEDGKTLQARINGKSATITLKSETDLILEKMGMGGAAGAGSGKVKAPMPGLIVKVLVKPGDLVEKGQVLLNFEAMKMENQLKSPVAGVVKEIKVSQGDKIEKGQHLAEIG